MILHSHAIYGEQGRLNGSTAPAVAVLADAVVQDLNLVAVQQPPAVNLFSVFTHPCIFLWGGEDDRYGIYRVVHQ